MKKDVFNGKISTEYRGYVKFTLILAAAVFIVCGIIFLAVAIFYANVEYTARIFLYCAGPISITLGISYPLITLHLIRIYPKRRKITRHFIKEYLFREYDDCVEKRIYKNY